MLEEVEKFPGELSVLRKIRTEATVIQESHSQDVHGQAWDRLREYRQEYIEKREAHLRTTEAFKSGRTNL